MAILCFIFYSGCFLLILFHTCFKLFINILTVNNKHKLCINICTSHIHIKRSYNGNIIIYGHTFPMIRNSTLIFFNCNSGIYNVFLMIKIIHCTKYITIILCRISHNGCWNFYIFKFIIHIVITNYIRSMNLYFLLCIFCQIH